MKIQVLKQARPLIKLGYSKDLAIMIALSAPVVKKMNVKMDAITDKLDLLIVGHRLLAADQVMKRQEASEITPKGD